MDVYDKEFNQNMNTYEHYLSYIYIYIIILGKLNNILWTRHQDDKEALLWTSS